MNAMSEQLANHLWQSTAFVLVVALAAHALRRNAPRLRYWLWLTASIKFLIPFSLIVSTGARIQLPPETPVPLADTVVQISTYFEPASAPYFESAAEGSGPIPSRSGFPWRLAVASVWVVGALFVAVRWFRRWRTIHRAVNGATRLPIQSSVPILSSPGLMEPGVFGLFHPVLLLPEGIAEKLTPKQFEAVLAHELRHIRCFDNLTAAVHMGITALFWFHPLVWWIGARLMDERERDCDEAVLRQGSQRADYARGILQVCATYVEPGLPCASGISGSDLKKRVQGIMTWRGSRPVTSRGKAILVSTSIAAVFVPFSIGVLRAQTEPIQNIVGDYSGVMSGPGVPGGLGARLHIQADAESRLSGTLEFTTSQDIPAGARMPVFRLTDIRVTGRSLSFTVPIDDEKWKDSFGDRWQGSIESNGARLNGAFTRKVSMQLVLTRETAQSQTRPETPQTERRPEGPPNATRPGETKRWNVVSIRPCQRDGGRYSGPGPFRFSPDRMFLNCLTARSLIRSAYRVYVANPRPGEEPLDDVLTRGIGVPPDPGHGMAGGPEWLDTDFYTIEARAEGVADRALMQGPMLQAVLEDRFKIKVHRETRDIPLDALVIAKGGPKLKLFVEGSCVRRSPPQAPAWLAWLAWGRRDCRIERGGLGSEKNRRQGNMVYHAEGVTIDEFVKLFVTGYRGRVVIDKTGLTGRFDIHLETEIGADFRERIDPSGDLLGPSTAPPLHEALQRQLGLRLESTKGPVPFLVIDHIERPSPN